VQNISRTDSIIHFVKTNNANFQNTSNSYTKPNSIYGQQGFKNALLKTHAVSFILNQTIKNEMTSFSSNISTSHQLFTSKIDDNYRFDQQAYLNQFIHSSALSKRTQNEKNTPEKLFFSENTIDRSFLNFAFIKFLKNAMSRSFASKSESGKIILYGSAFIRSGDMVLPANVVLNKSRAGNSCRNACIFNNNFDREHEYPDGISRKLNSHAKTVVVS
jgi:hypothetical protein